MSITFKGERQGGLSRTGTNLSATRVLVFYVDDGETKLDIYAIAIKLTNIFCIFIGTYLI